MPESWIVPMTTLTITISEEQLTQLQALAAQSHLTPEELVQMSIEELLSQSDEKFERVLNYVLQKNSELYHRLA